MAQITWKNIDLPNFGVAIGGLSEAGRSFDRAVGNFSKITETNRQQTLENIQNMDQQAQANIMEQIAGFSTSEQLQEAIASGNFDVAQAGMSGAARIASQEALLDRSNTLLDQEQTRQEIENAKEAIEIDRKQVAVAEKNANTAAASQKLNERRFTEIDLKEAENKQKQFDWLVADMKLAAEIKNSVDPFLREAELQSEMKEVYEQFPHAYQNGVMDSKKLTNEEKEDLRAQLKTLQVNSATEYAFALSRAAEFNDPKFASEVMTYVDTMSTLTREGNKFTKMEEQRQESEYLRLNPQLNKNPYYLKQKERESGKTIAQRLIEEHPDLIKDLPRPARIALLEGGFAEEQSLTLNGKTVPVPVLYEDIVTVLSSNGRVGFIEDLVFSNGSGEILSDTMLARLGTVPKDVNWKGDLDAFNTEVSRIRSNSNASPESNLNNAIKSLTNALEYDKQEAAGKANDDLWNVINQMNSLYGIPGTSSTSGTTSQATTQKVRFNRAVEKEYPYIHKRIATLSSDMTPEEATAINNASKELIQGNITPGEMMKRLDEIQLRLFKSR